MRVDGTQELPESFKLAVSSPHLVPLLVNLIFNGFRGRTHRSQTVHNKLGVRVIHRGQTVQVTRLGVREIHRGQTVQKSEWPQRLNCAGNQTRGQGDPQR